MQDKRSLILLTVGLLLAQGLAGCVHIPPAHKYPAGTVGSLYEECRDAIQYTSTPKEYLKTECSRFGMSLAFGAFLAFMKNHGDYTGYQVSDPSCAAQIETERKHLKDSVFCKNSDGETVYPVAHANFAYTIARWGEWLEFYDRDMLQKPVFPYINKAINDGPFCKYILGTNLKDTAIKPNKRLMNSSPAEWREAEEAWEKNPENQIFLLGGDNLSVKTYKACIQDIERSGDDALRFSSTPCGKDASAFMSGLFMTDTIETEPLPEDACYKDLKGLHKYEILAKDACFTKNINTVLDFTKESIARYTYDAAKNQVTRKKEYVPDHCNNQ